MCRPSHTTGLEGVLSLSTHQAWTIQLMTILPLWSGSLTGLKHCVSYVLLWFSPHDLLRDERKLQLSGIICLHPLSANRVPGATVTFLQTLQSFVGNKKAMGRIALVGNLYGTTLKDGNKRLEELKKNFFTPFLNAGADVFDFDGTTS